MAIFELLHQRIEQYKMKNIGIALISVGIFLVVKIFAMMLVAAGSDVAPLWGLPELSNPMIASISTVLSSVAILLIFYLWRPLADLVDRWRSLPIRYIFVCFVLGWSGLILNSFMLSGLMDSPSDSLHAALPLLDAGVLGLIGVVVFVPIVEELVFRRVLIGSLSKTIHPYLAIIVSSIVFGALHGESIQILGATVIGLILGWLYYQSKSILPSIILHIFNNGSFMFQLYGYKKDGEKLLDTDILSFSFGHSYGIYLFIVAAIAFGLLAFLHFRMSKKIHSI